MDIGSFIREMPGKGRCDLTPLLRDAEAFGQLVRGLGEPFADSSVSHVVAIDAMGFILGGAVARALDAEFIPVRKAGKAAWSTVSRDVVDYSGTSKALHLVADSLDQTSRVLKDVCVEGWVDKWFTDTQATVNSPNAEFCS